MRRLPVIAARARRKRLFHKLPGRSSRSCPERIPSSGAGNCFSRSRSIINCLLNCHARLRNIALPCPAQGLRGSRAVVCRFPRRLKICSSVGNLFHSPRTRGIRERSDRRCGLAKRRKVTFCSRVNSFSGTFHVFNFSFTFSSSESFPFLYKCQHPPQPATGFADRSRLEKGFLERLPEWLPSGLAHPRYDLVQAIL